MLDINWIKAHPDAYERARATRKNVPYSASELIGMDDARRSAITQVEEAQARRNALSKQIGQAKAQKDEAKAQALMAEVAGLKDTIQNGEAARKDAEDKLRQALLVVPNVPLDDVPVGEDEHDNVEYFGPNGNAATAAKVRPPKPTFTFAPKEHYELGEAMGQMDFEIAAKLSGSRFVVLKSHLARLERAIGQFMLDLHVDEHGYTEVEPPLLVKDDALYGTGQLPKFKDDQFQSISLTWPDKDELSRDTIRGEVVADFVKGNRDRLLKKVASKHVYMGDFSNYYDVTAEIFDNTLSEVSRLIAEQNLQRLLAAYENRVADQRRWLIPTAEVPLTNLVRESILSEDQLPMRLTALTPCFRSEAGSAGRDTRGMLRQHQFNKVEMVAITTPETSVFEQEKMLADAEDVLKKLGLHYRIMTLSTGDMGFGAQKTYDIEVWLPGQDTYREISSVSVCGDFQARRMEARYRPKNHEGKGALPYVHTLNGSGVAVGRALIAVMENYQQEDGSIAIPEPLRPYMKGLTSIGGKS